MFVTAQLDSLILIRSKHSSSLVNVNKTNIFLKHCSESTLIIILSFVCVEEQGGGEIIGEQLYIASRMRKLSWCAHYMYVDFKLRFIILLMVPPVEKWAVMKDTMTPKSINDKKGSCQFHQLAENGIVYWCWLHHRRTIDYIDVAACCLMAILKTVWILSFSPFPFLIFCLL